MKSISHKVDLQEMCAKWPRFTMRKRFAVLALLDMSSDEEQEEEEVAPRASKNNLGFWHRWCQQWWSQCPLWLRQIQQAPKTSCLHPLLAFSDLKGQTLRPIQRLVIKIQQQRTESHRLEKLAQTLAKEGKTLKSTVYVSTMYWLKAQHRWFIGFTPLDKMLRTIIPASDLLCLSCIAVLRSLDFTPSCLLSLHFDLYLIRGFLFLLP